MRRRGPAGWWVLLACLVLAGLIRAATPEYIPDEYEVHPDDAGRAVSTEFTVELLDAARAQSVRVVTEWSEEVVATEHAFVVARMTLTPHGGTLTPTVQIRTRDGHSYDYLSVTGLPGARLAYVGTTVETSYVFEVPADKIDGARLAVHGRRPDGLMPVSPVVLFGLPDLADVGQIDLLPDVEGPVR